MEEKAEKRAHSCFLQNRSGAAVTGVCDVLSFDENQVIMDTDLGLATLKGKNLHVSRLTLEKGEVDVEGQIDSLTYSSNDAYRKSAQTFLSRLFG
ncbi:MAG: sporulation protein YabP [Clostridiales bacterium]|nr:sporulation protein YabP [Clostridiales bacterium]